MRTGDIAVPSYTTKDAYIKNAAEEIDAALGHLYVTPFEIEDEPENRPAILYLKKINWLLASGRMLSDAAAAGEETSLNAYAQRMLNEAMSMLEALTGQKYVMVGAELIFSGDEARPTGPMVFNEDPQSMVEQFYVGQSPYRNPYIPYPRYPIIKPYGYPKVV
jgi:hypothetical protein